MSEAKYWLGFNLVSGIGPAKVEALLHEFGDLQLAWEAPETRLQKVGLDRASIANLRQAREKIDLDLALERVQQSGATLLTWDSPDYPVYLREIPAPPPLLYMHGALADIDRWAVAVVGTRRLTKYGRQITQQIVSGLVQSGVTIVSGLARGVDGIAHKSALDAGGRTIAVLGSGLDRVYPAEHRELSARIREGRGAVLSEYALGVAPEARNFPPRNRVISGVSLGVVVVEAGERSGALITARYAVEQDREVFAVPGYIYSPASKGTNRLIQDGAKLVMSVDDILEELNLRMVLEHEAAQLALPETAEEAALYKYLSSQPVHVDDLGHQTGLPSSLVSSTLTLMELKGMVQQVGGMNYVLGREPGPEYEANIAT